jgi:hypothetical protein
MGLFKKKKILGEFTNKTSNMWSFNQQMSLFPANELGQHGIFSMAISLGCNMR